MPRRIQYDAEKKNPAIVDQWGDVDEKALEKARNAYEVFGEEYLPAIRYGKNEITAEEYEALSMALYPSGAMFDHQFTTYGLPNPKDRTATMDKAHTWLSEHSTGPWYWHEGPTNHGHHTDTAIYIEREPDQAAFHAAFPDLFKYHPIATEDMHGPALLRGVLAPRTETESLIVWTHNHDGYREEIIGDEKRKPRRLRLTFYIPELQEKFEEDWGDQILPPLIFNPNAPPATSFDVLDNAEIRAEDGRCRTIHLWLSDHKATGNISGGPKGWQIKIRYPETRTAFEETWGHVFTRGEDGITYNADDYPSPPTRAIPEDFQAYIRGEREDYAAPYVKVLTPKLPAKPETSAKGRPLDM